MKLPDEMRAIPFKERCAFNALFALAHFAPRNEWIQQRRDGVRQRIAEQLREGGAGRVFPVAREDKLSAHEFQNRYLANGLPVILPGAAAEWTCAKEWSFESFKQRFGQTMLKLVNHKGLSDDDVIYDREYTHEICFNEFLDQALAGGMQYMRFSPILESFPELRKDFDDVFLREMPGWSSLGTTFEAFIGGKKSYTPLHNAPTPFFFVNVCGIKRWAMIPNHYLAAMNPAADGMSYNHSGADFREPDAENFPGFESVDRFEAVIGPGDILFVPSWFWHSVQNEAPTIGVRCGFMYPKSMVAESLTLAFIRTFAARNPSLADVLRYTFLRRDLPTRTNMLLQPRMFWNHHPAEWLASRLR